MIRHFRTLMDLSPSQLTELIDRAIYLKRLRGTTHHPTPLDGKSVAILLEKASTRTRLSFEVGIHELGGLPVTLLRRDTQLDRGEPLEDTARMLNGYVHAVVYRTFGHDRLEQLVAASKIPVINGLSDSYHPCQVLADLMTIIEAKGGPLRGTRVAWIGDGNNMAHSWILAAGLLGLDLVVATPANYAPDPAIVQQGLALGGGQIELTHDPVVAAKDADVVTTDVWASMGQEQEAAARRNAFANFCVDDALIGEAKKDAIFLHCLPAHRGEEVSASVIDGPQSRVWEEAENRLHAQKALLEYLMK